MQGAALLAERAKQLSSYLSSPTVRSRAKHARRTVQDQSTVAMKLDLGQLAVETIGARSAGKHPRCCYYIAKRADQPSRSDVRQECIAVRIMH